LNLMDERERTEVVGHEGRAPERVKLGVLVGRVAGGFTGGCVGVTLGVWTGWGAAPIILGVAGMGAGALFSDFVFRLFPRLAPEQTVTARAAARGVSGIFVGLLLGDIVGTFTSLDRAYTVLVGAALGFYVGVVFGNNRRRE
jgi:hypothetical protein